MRRILIFIISVIFNLCFMSNICANSFDECNPAIQTCVHMTLIDRFAINVWIAIYEGDLMKGAIELNKNHPSFTYAASKLDTDISLKILNEECFNKSLKGPILQNVLIHYDLEDKKFICQPTKHAFWLVF